MIKVLLSLSLLWAIDSTSVNQQNPSTPLTAPFKPVFVNDTQSSKIASECARWAQRSRANRIVLLYEGKTVYHRENLQRAYDFQNCMRHGSVKTCPVKFKNGPMWNDGYLTQHALTHIAKNCADKVEFMVLDHGDEKPRRSSSKGLRCFDQFYQRRSQGQLKVLVVGHSNGGPAAALAAQRLQNAGFKNFELVMVDSVRRNVFSLLGDQADPDRLHGSDINVGQAAYHFYQKNSSHPLTKFTNRAQRANTKIVDLSKSGVNHFNILKHQKVKQALEKICQ